MADRYCGATDLMVGDVTVASGKADLWVNTAADEMDAEIGFHYQVPIVVSGLALHIALTLKRCNALIASGRFLLAQATAGWDCKPADWTCEGGSTIGISKYSMNMGVPITQSTHTSHEEYVDPPEETSWW